ncbi:hypothetical protein BDV93DRAFT_526679 [Ceratobasidium sp. AG-I]|nr:hypothetical protein BDV93DRAFT_526679 [Ceratobasidium sp. AG-I]
MRHERHERPHSVRQTQPGRVERPTRPPKFDPTNLSASTSATIDYPPPRRTTTRKRTTIGPNIFPSSSDSELAPGSNTPSKRSWTNQNQGEKMGDARMDELVGLGRLVVDLQLRGPGLGGRVQDERYESVAIRAGGIGDGNAMRMDGGFGAGVGECWERVGRQRQCRLWRPFKLHCSRSRRMRMLRRARADFVGSEWEGSGG